MTSHFEDLATVLLEEAKTAGADEAQVIVAGGSDKKVVLERNALQLASSTEETAFQLKVHVDHRQGTAQTNSMAKEDFRQIAVNAVTLARRSPEDPYLCMPKPQSVTPLEGLSDPALRQLPVNRLKDLAVEFLAAGREDPRVQIDGGEVLLKLDQELLVNSHGIALKQDTTQLEWVISGQALEGEEVTSFDYVSGGSFHLRDADASMLGLARKFNTNLIRLFGAGSGSSYKGPVLLTPRAVKDLVIDPLQMHLSGLQVAYGKSQLGDDQKGETLAATSFSLWDRPRDTTLMGAAAFDGEVAPTQERAFFEKGVFLGHMENSYSANRRSTVSTGHCGLGIHNPVVSPGSQSVSEMRGTREGLLEVCRFSGNVDGVSGDFSGVAKNSVLWSGGEAKPVKEIMIAGNLFDVLKAIVGVGEEALSVDDGARAPHLLVDGISVTAKT